MLESIKSKINFDSIKTKMCLVFGGISVISFLCLTVILYNRAMSASETNTSSMILQSVKQSAALVRNGLDANINMGRGFGDNQTITNSSKDEKTAYKSLRDNKGTYSHLDIGLINLKGIQKSENGTTTDISNKEYFQKALAGEVSISDPYFDDKLQKEVISYLIPAKVNGKVVTIVYYVREAQEISNLVKNLKTLSSGNTFIVNRSGSMIANVNEQLVKDKFNPIQLAKSDKSYSAFAEVIQSMIDRKTGIGTYDYQGFKKLTAYAPIEGTDWSVGIGLKNQDLSDVLKSFKYAAIFISILGIAVIIVLTRLFANVIAKRINNIYDNVREIAGGNFSIDIDRALLEDKSELGLIANGVSELKQSLSLMISSVKSIGEGIDDKSTSLSAFSEELSASTGEINATIGTIAEGNVQQANKLNDVTAKVNEFEGKVKNVGTYIDDVHSNTLGIEKTAKGSATVVSEMNESSARFNDIFNEFNDNVKLLEKDMNTVSEIINIIDSISDQTNLLALNAAIEAARAGDAGKGFAVVADEIRNLAEQSKNSAEKIYNIVTKSSDNTKSIVDKTVNINKELSNQQEGLKNVSTVFNSIVDAVGNVIPQLDKTYKEFAELNHSSLEIKNNIEDITEISQASSASSEEILASSSELNKASGDLADAAQALSGNSDTIMEELDKFKL